MMDIRPISKELQRKAKEELNEDPKRIKHDIEHIKEWLEKQRHLIARTEDQWILAFLRGCKFSLERTKEKIDMYYTARTVAPEFFAERNPFDPAIQEFLKLGILLPLRKTKGPDTPRVFLLRSGIQDPGSTNIFKFITLNSMLMDILINEDDQGIIAGVIFIQDMKGLTMAHLAQMTPGIIKKSSVIFQESMPTRPKQLHYLNLPSFFDTMYQMMKSFIKEKLRKRIVLHTKDNLEGLYEYVPKDILPIEYGGTEGTLQELTDYWKQKVESYEQWFLDDGKYGTDESKRLGKPKIGDEIFGMEGAFRKLEVD